MRWVLPGGAVLDGRNRKDSELGVACRPLAAVEERTKPCLIVVPEQPEKGPRRRWRLAKVKQFLEVLALIVGIIGAILAWFGLSRK